MRRKGDSRCWSVSIKQTYVVHSLHSFTDNHTPELPSRPQFPVSFQAIIHSRNSIHHRSDPSNLTFNKQTASSLQDPKSSSFLHNPQNFHVYAVDLPLHLIENNHSKPEPISPPPETHHSRRERERTTSSLFKHKST